MKIAATSANTPLLLIAWRRPDALRQVIEAIRPVGPKRLFVACDGPNPDRPEEVNKVAMTRQVIENEIDWPCKIERLYSDKNQGCRLGVSRAISWFFEHVEEGVILEDDCIPHPDFFRFCSILLEHFRHDHRIWSICGSNFQTGNRRGNGSYYFSIHGDSWGWATWRRAWHHYAKTEELWPAFRDSGQLKSVFQSPQEEFYWRTILNLLFTHQTPSAWDYQWWLTGWMNNALHVWPNSCLISNIGFGEEGSNTFGDDPFARLPLEGIAPVISHPQFVVPNREADNFAFLNRRGGHRLMRTGPFYKWVMRARAIRQIGLRRYLKPNWQF